MPFDLASTPGWEWFEMRLPFWVSTGVNVCNVFYICMCCWYKYEPKNLSEREKYCPGLVKKISYEIFRWRLVRHELQWFKKVKHISSTEAQVWDFRQKRWNGLVETNPDSEAFLQLRKKYKNGLPSQLQNTLKLDVKTIKLLYVSFHSKHF